MHRWGSHSVSNQRDLHVSRGDQQRPAERASNRSVAEPGSVGATSNWCRYDTINVSQTKTIQRFHTVWAEHARADIVKAGWNSTRKQALGLLDSKERSYWSIENEIESTGFLSFVRHFSPVRWCFQPPAGCPCITKSNSRRIWQLCYLPLGARSPTKYF